jgi:ubiquitin carboxyl-terminal hydrolase L5
MLLIPRCLLVGADHFQFYSKMDILNADLQLKSEATSKKRYKGQDTGDSDATFHFIAFMPAMGQVWKFDGLERQPQSLGSYAPDPLKLPSGDQSFHIDFP